MRIARIIEYFPPHIGGMERHGLILSQEQIKLGHSVDIFIGFGNKNLLPNIRKTPLQFLPMYSKIRRFWFNFWAYNAVKKHHKENPYNIIHLHGDFIEAYFGSRLSKKFKIPAVLTIHAGLNRKFLKPKNTVYFAGIK
ncbi:MAG: glycosyltransferase family 4 protein, partial [Candidatus Omnitrophota bacterium]|nr:glycosyltransferase family 4 protein [Candidatus Omnitrophota bacterium]